MLNFELAVKTAMEELDISEFDAVIELVWYMCSHGTIDDFKDLVNYIIRNQDRWINAKMEKG